jgi:hypothetical protein
MSELDQGLQKVEDMSPIVTVSKKVGFHNQANIKAAARGIVLEALTAFKGGKVGKRGLLVKAMARLERALESGDPEESRWGAEQVLKLANGMTKDDKAGQTLTDLLQAGNATITFNTYFEARQSLPGQVLTIGHAKPASTPPSGSGDPPGLG